VLIERPHRYRLTEFGRHADNETDLGLDVQPQG
jgi:hypothetical protein